MKGKYSTHLNAKFSNENFQEKRPRGKNRHRQRNRLILGLKKENLRRYIEIN